MKKAIFTPFDPKGVTDLPADEMGRVKMVLSVNDNAKVGRARQWQATVCDLNTGRMWRVREASCGLPRCCCAASVMSEVEG